MICRKNSFTILPEESHKIPLIFFMCLLAAFFCQEALHTVKYYLLLSILVFPPPLNSPASSSEIIKLTDMTEETGKAASGLYQCLSARCEGLC